MDLTASLTLVVDGGVAVALHAADTVVGGTTAVIADLTVGGVGQAGIPVTFTLAGPGLLSATAGQTDGAGRAEVVYFGTDETSVTVTAQAVVDGQTYTRTVTINVGAVDPDMRVRILNDSYAWVRQGFPLPCPEAEQWVTLAGVLPMVPSVGQCDQVLWDSGDPTEPPVSLAAETPRVWNSSTITKPDANTLVWSIAGSGAVPSVDASAVSVMLEFSFATAGTLEIQVDRSLLGPDVQYGVILRLPSFAYLIYSHDAHVAPPTAATLNVPGPSTVSLQGTISVIEGAGRFTFIFRPQ